MKIIPDEEFKKNLDIYRKSNCKFFAAIKVGGECMDKILIEALRGIYDHDLLPLVLHGGGKQIDDALKEANIPTHKIDGKRVTDQATLDILVKTITALNEDFVKRLNSKGEIAYGLNGVLHATDTDPVYGFAGDAIGIDSPSIQYCSTSVLIPIISCLGINKKGYSNINADSAFNYVVGELKPIKVIMLTPTGGVLKEDKLISNMNKEELHDFINSEYVDGGMKLKLTEAEKLVCKGFDVQITSPRSLMIELFSDKGKGTYLSSK